MKKSNVPHTETDEKEFPGLNGGLIKVRTAKSGIVKFTNMHFESTDKDKKDLVFDDRIFLDWQGLTELMDDHGHSTICGILHPLGLYILSDDKKIALLLEIKSKIQMMAGEG